MSNDAIAEELARTLRVAHLLGLVSLLGHASFRVGEEKILITPGRAEGSPPPNRLRAEDLVTVGLDGATLAGRFPPPRDMAMHLAIYRARPEVDAVLHTHQPEMLAFGVVDRELRALAHQGADMIQSPLPRFGSGELVTTEEQAAALVRNLGAAPACQLPGHGLVVVGGELAEVLCRAQQLEELANMSRLAASMGELKTVAPDQAERIARQRASMADFRGYYSDIDPGPKPTPPPIPTAETVEGVKELVARACHILCRFGVVHHLEHVSQRLPDPNRFVISPRSDLGRLTPEQVATVDMTGRWVDGPLEPPPFRFLHRDIFSARADVRAIVHTHELYGRLFPAAGISVAPINRTGACLLRRAVPVFDVPDLIFDEEPRKAVVVLLGEGSIVHERAHGTDYVAGTIEEATAAAVHREWGAKLYHRAAQLGPPRPLSAAVLERLADEEPSAREWWDYWSGL
jgi:ribulose-5-phosphate 4-epimerase/fuculose-1-phosphate aldolase